jgi:ATP diphosphatase
VLDEAGDLLFAAVNVCRLAGVHPMTALAGATDKFSRRFRAVADRARTRGIDMTVSDLVALNELWDDVKREESQ